MISLHIHNTFAVFTKKAFYYILIFYLVKNFVNLKSNNLNNLRRIEFFFNLTEPCL